MTVSEKKKLVIVGGGVSGLFVAWRVLSSDPNFDVQIFERSARTGGRLATLHVPLPGRDGPTLQVEEGGMRFQDQHKHLKWALEKLDLAGEVQRFGMGTEENFYYIRGKYFSRKDADIGTQKKGAGAAGCDADQAVWNTLYNLKNGEQNKSPAELLSGIVRELAERNNMNFPTTSMQWEQFRKSVRVDELTLNDWGFKPLLFNLGYSREAVSMIETANGFTCPFDMPVCAGAALQLFANFPIEPMFWTLKGGYEQLTLALRKQVKDLEGTIDIATTVKTVKRLEEKNRWEIIYTHDNREYSMEADLVVLAVPPRDLIGIQLGEVHNFDRIIDSVVEMPLTKMNFFYKKPWWMCSRFKVKHGGCFTDLPLSQVYFFDSPADHVSLDQATPVLTIYSDGRNATFWRQLQELGRPFSHMREFQGLTSCSSKVVTEAMRQLQLMFDLKEEMPPPMLATYRAWGNSDTGSGDHLWRTGVELLPRDRDLYNPACNLYICGESFSEQQAWVEGALMSAEQIAQHLSQRIRAPELRNLRPLGNGCEETI